MTPSPSPVAALINRLLPGIRHPWLFVLLAGLFAADLVFPDPLPLIDEAILAVLTVLAASWRTRTGETPPPPKDVTPPDEMTASLPKDRPGDPR